MSGFLTFMDRYRDEAACITALAELRWPNGFICAGCAGLRFQHETLNQEQFQPVATINYPSEKVPFTRVTEYKHLTGQVHPKTARPRLPKEVTRIMKPII